MHKDDSAKLEYFIDIYGIDEVLKIISLICFEKAEHLKTNRQMSPNSIEVCKWEKEAKRLSR